MIIESISITLQWSFYGQITSNLNNDEILLIANNGIAPSAVGECLPEITGLDNDKRTKALIFSNLKNQRITGLYRIK